MTMNPPNHVQSAAQEASKASTDEAARATRQWLRDVVVGLKLCPFAAELKIERDLAIVVCEASEEAIILESLASLLGQLHQAATPETGLLVLTNGLSDFLDYNDFLNQVDDLLDAGPWAGLFQVASFHPHYQFAGTAPHDVENYTNRSPFPVFHVLREASVTRALDKYPNAGNEVPERNKATLAALTASQIQALWPWVKA